MEIHSNSRSVSDQLDPQLAQLFDEIHDQLVSGESVDVDAYIVRAPAHAQAIRQQVALMRAMVSMGDSTTNKGTHQDQQSIRQQIGEFSIVREIGRGGMGVVYEAEQSALQRRVALKILPLASLASDRQLDRFRNEARAVASLHHPHIVSIYSIGREQGVHYFAMQLIDGPSLAEVIHRLQSEHDNSVTQNRGNESPFNHIDATTADNEGALSIGAEPTFDCETRREIQAAISTQRTESRYNHFRTVARWVTEAAEALAHAHERCILHRDIKPANLLIDQDRRLWVTDFGLARLESEQTLSASADIVGTLRYMSPEQAMGKRELIDHRSDIYSLGITLYELLALQPAFTGAERQQLLDQVISQRPTDLRSVDASIPRELELIVGKATERDREDRYSSAQEFANDLQAFIENRTITARPLTVLERGARWVRHHQRVTVGILALLLIFSLVLTAAITYVAKQRYEAVVARADSEANFALAEDAVNQLFTRVSESVLLNQPQMVNLRATLLEDALKYYEKLSLTSADSMEARRRSAIAQIKLGRILILLNRRDEAQDALQQGTDRLRNVIRKGAVDDQSRIDMAEGLRALNEANRLNLHNTSKPMSDRVSELEKRSHVARLEAINLLESLVTPIANKELLLSYLYLDEGDMHPTYSEARRRLHQKAIDAANRSIEIAPTPLAKLQRLICMREFLSYSDPKKEGRLWEEIIDSTAALVDQHPHMPEARYFLSCLYGNLATGGGSWKDQDPRNFSLPIAMELHEQFPSVQRYKWGLAMEYRNQATRGALDGADWKNVEKARRASIELLEELLQENPTASEFNHKLIEGLTDFSAQYKLRCDNTSRIGLYRTYIEVAERLTQYPNMRAEGFHQLTRAHREFAAVLYALGRIDDGRAHMRLAHDTARHVIKNADVQHAQDEASANGRRKQGRFDLCQVFGVHIPCELVWGDAAMAKSLTEEALRTLQEMSQLHGWTPDEIDMIKDWKASILCHVGHPELWRPGEALSLAEEVLSRHPDHRGSQTKKAIALFANQKFTDAESIFRRIREAIRDDERDYESYQNLKRQMMERIAMGRDDDAKKLLKELKTTDSKKPTSGWPELPLYSLYIAMIEYHQGDRASARGEFDDVRARWGSCDTFPHAAGLYRQAAALLSESNSVSVQPTQLPIKSPRPVFENLGRRSWRGLH